MTPWSLRRYLTQRRDRVPPVGSDRERRRVLHPRYIPLPSLVNIASTIVHEKGPGAIRPEAFDAVA